MGTSHLRSLGRRTTRHAHPVSRNPCGDDLALPARATPRSRRHRNGIADRSAIGLRFDVAHPRSVHPMIETDARVGLLHHVELWVPDLDTARPRWQWLLSSLGYQQFQLWDNGVSYQLGPTYIVLEQSPALIDGPHDRRRAGLNHLALPRRNTPSPGPTGRWLQTARLAAHVCRSAPLCWRSRQLRSVSGRRRWV